MTYSDLQFDAARRVGELAPGQGLLYIHNGETIQSLALDLSGASVLRNAITRAGLDISPCKGCGESVVCIPDGLPYCEPCAKKLESEQ